MYYIKLNKPCNFCYVFMTSWKFIICIVYFSVFCPYLVGAENYFLKNLVFQPENVLLKKNRNTEQIFLTSTLYFFCATFYIMRILCKQILRKILLLHFLYLVCPFVPVQGILQYPLSVFSRLHFSCGRIAGINTLPFSY